MRDGVDDVSWESPLYIPKNGIPIRIKVVPNDAKSKALRIMEAHGGETDDLEVIDELIKLLPNGSVFYREDGYEMSVKTVWSMRYDSGLDIR